MAKATEVVEEIVADVKAEKAKFKSSKPYLFLHHIGVQFREGVYETDNQAEIDALRTNSNVEEVK